MAGVFVSYAREDSARAQVIASAIEQSGFDVWFDQRIHSGSEFSREIESALASASAVVVLWSRSSIESAWVRDEAAEGRDSGRLVSVLLDDCRPPIGFRQFQTADLSGWSGRGRPKQLDNVIAAVRAKSGQAPAASTYRVARESAASFPRLGWMVAAFVLLIAAGGFWYLRGGERQAQALSVALLPFTADASDAEARKLAPAIRDALAHTLSQGAFAITTAEQQADASNADFVISGHVTSTTENVTASVRMQESARNIVVFSHQFQTARDKAAGFAELVGAQVASQLSWTAPLLSLERRHPSDPSVVTSLLQSSAAGLDGVGTLHDYEMSRRVAADAPRSPLAQNSFAFNTAFVLSELPRTHRAGAVAAGRAAADSAVRLAPEFGDNYTPWCLLRSEQRRAQCEDRLRDAMRTDPDSPFVNWFLSYLILNPVGRNQEAAELASLSLAHDQYMPFKIGLVLRTLETIGRSDDAAALYARAQQWWPQSESVNWFRLTGMAAGGAFDSAERFDAQVNGDGASNPVLAAINRKSLPAIRRACTPDITGLSAIACMLGLARLGDLDSAYAFADRLYPSRRGAGAADEERIWIDEPQAMSVSFLTASGAAPLRRDPRYLALAERVGLLEYWRGGRPPDFCREKPEPICPKLLARD